MPVATIVVHWCGPGHRTENEKERERLGHKKEKRKAMAWRPWRPSAGVCVVLTLQLIRLA